MAKTISIRSRLPSHGAVNAKILTTLQIRTRLAKRSLAVRGMMESVSWSFIPAEHAELFGGGGKELKLANPIAADMSDMRPSLLPGLLAAAQRNADHGVGDVALFEVGATYEGDKPEDQRRVAGGIRRGTAGLTGGGRHWAGNGDPVGVFDAKADALAALEACGAPVANLQIEAGAPRLVPSGPFRRHQARAQGRARPFRRVPSRALEALDVSGALCGFEIFIDAIPEPKKKPTRTKQKLEVSPFQMLRRDYAFVVDRDVTAQTLLRAVAGADKKLIVGVNVFDVFEGASLGEGKKSVALEVSIQPVDRTLTDEDLEALSAKIVANVEKAGGVLRG
jgi:phenylalanyl-tRNA synthetase beta chain